MTAYVKFSIDAMRRCSGNALYDDVFAENFCKEALSRAEAAASKLCNIADLSIWSDNLRAEMESTFALITALQDTAVDFMEFFKQKPIMVAPFVNVLPKLRKSHKRADDARKVILGWLQENNAVKANLTSNQL